MKFRIKESREMAGYSQKELAEIIGVAPNTFHGYESGKHDPKSDLLIKIANACHVTTDYMLGISDSPLSTISLSLSQKEAGHIQKYRLLDQDWKKAVDSVLDIGYSRCCDSFESSSDDMEISEELAEPLYFIVPRYYSPMSAGHGQTAGDEYPDPCKLKKAPPKGTSYIAPIRGDSMEPSFHDGQSVFVHATEDIEVGKIGVFFMNGQQWIKEFGEGELISHNPKYAPMPLTEDFRCQGLVLGVCDESYLDLSDQKKSITHLQMRDRQGNILC